MRSLAAARDAWDEVKQYHSLQELRTAVRLNGNSSIATAGGRSACWKAFLLFESLDASEWIRTLSSTRSAYNSLKSHFLRHIENPDELTAGYDPLSGEVESSPWAQLRKDEELRGEILQDVVRCMPENMYFRQPDTQRTLTDILFIFCKLNPDIGYRQGMHELLAPILWVVEKDAIDLGESSKAMGEDAVVKAVFDADHIEHDTFALFGQVMQSAKSFYEQTTSNGRENPMVARSRRIFSDMLPLVDQKLAKHLEQIDIVPQVFLIRWIRLLFGREFAFDEMLTLWDVLFAEDPSLEIVDHICLAMLLRIRWDLIDADYNVALTLLLRYPEPDGQLPAQTFALDGLYLREHMDQHCGSYLVAKYTGKPLEQAGRPVTPPALQRNITTFSGENVAKAASADPSLSPSRSPRPSRNLESVLSSTAKNIYARGEKLGINKVVRNAVDEVHRKAQEIRDAQTPSTPPSWRQRGGSRSSLGAGSWVDRVQSLETRSKQLSKLLEGAVGELWEYQKAASEGNGGTAENSTSNGLEQLSVAIAKVQFIQVYLADPGLPLPQETNEPDPKGDATGTGSSPDEKNGSVLRGRSQNIDEGLNSTQSTENSHNCAAVDLSAAGDDVQSEKAKEATIEAPSVHVEGPTGPSTFDEPLSASPAPQAARQDHVGLPAESTTITTNVASSVDQGKAIEPGRTSLNSSRPRLEGSSFSWMLGQEDGPARQNFASASSLPPEHSRLKSSLFGATKEENSIGGRRSSSSGSKQRPKKTEESGTGADADEGFDLGSLRHSKVRKA